MAFVLTMKSAHACPSGLDITLSNGCSMILCLDRWLEEPCHSELKQYFDHSSSPKSRTDRIVWENGAELGLAEVLEIITDGASIDRVNTGDSDVLIVDLCGGHTIMLEFSMLLRQEKYAVLAQDDRIYYPHPLRDRLVWKDGTELTVDEILTLLMADVAEKHIMPDGGARTNYLKAEERTLEEELR